MLGLARSALSARITVGMRTGQMPDNSAAIARLISAVAFQRQNTISLDLAGANAAATLPDDAWAEKGFSFLERQSSGIGGGTTEMARNNISEKVLKMPREITHDKNMPFRDVPEGPARQLSGDTRTDARREEGEPANRLPLLRVQVTQCWSGGRRRGGRGDAGASAARCTS